MKHLQNYFTQNGYDAGLFLKLLNDYVTSIFRPVTPIVTVPKKKMYLSMPFLGAKQQDFSKQLKSILSKFYPFLEIHIAPINSLTTGSFFKFKDSLPMEFIQVRSCL